jgi:tRNA threonylcarbamoyladenosine biosynthesis protein TsaB
MNEGAILAIDTAFGPIGVALVAMDGQTIAAESVLDALGAQAEKLPPLVERMLTESQLPVRALRRIAVTVGPGAFTGVRVGLAFAKGLALALKVPLLGYTSLECLARQGRAARPGAASYAAVIDARRGEFYVQTFDGEFATVFGPAVTSGDTALRELARLPGPLVITGSGAAVIGMHGGEVLDIHTVDAQMLALRALHDDPAAHPAVPCYLRAPDARLPS